jgi:dipeptidyl aminopeptidase/acylaminoacyl peptidase
MRVSIIKKGSSPQTVSPDEFNPTKQPKGVSQVLYSSGGLKLKAWVSENPNDGKKRPAVLFLHGGFGFSESDWKDAATFEQAGFIVMVPMLRGENGNPGNFELFYGEVNDAIAAGAFLKKLSYVDATNVFVAGHSAGGTLTQLASMMSGEFRAAASFSGSPDQQSFCHDWADIVPFDISNVDEIRIRSPLRFPESVCCPLFLYAGNEEEKYAQQNQSLATAAQKLGRPVTFTMVTGDHYTALKFEFPNAIQKFKALLVSSK